MPTTVIVLLAIVMAAGVVTAVSATTHDGRQPFGRAWISARFENHPRIAHFFSGRLDRSTAGGLLLTIGLVGVAAVFDIVDGGYGLAGLDERVAGYGLAHGDAVTFDIYRWFTHLGGTLVIIAVTLIVAA